MTEFLGPYPFITRPSLQNEADYKRRPRTQYLVVHCAATPASWDGGAEEIREWHVNDRGWMDIGYHFVIRRDGSIETGRPLWSVGAGVTGQNYDSIHICYVGGVNAANRPEDNRTGAQRESLWLLLRMLVAALPDVEVLGHRDFPGVRKACPSFDVRSWWEAPEYYPVSS